MNRKSNIVEFNADYKAKFMEVNENCNHATDSEHGVITTCNVILKQMNKTDETSN